MPRHSRLNLIAKWTVTEGPISHDMGAKGCMVNNLHALLFVHRLQGRM